MPMVERATVAECDLCDEVGYSPITDEMMGWTLTAPEGWLLVEQSWDKTEKSPSTLKRLVFCSWPCLADYADEQDPTAQAMLVEGT